MGDTKRKDNKPRRPRKPKCINIDANKTQLRKDHNTLKVLYSNSDNSLRKKLDELKHEVALEDPDLIFVTEVKPKNGAPTPCEVLDLSSYTLFLNKAYNEDGTRGTAIYAKDYLSANLVENEIINKFKDSTWVEVHGNIGKILLGCIYRSGTHAKACSLDPVLHEAITHMSNLKDYADVVIVGDFNHPKIKWKRVEYDFDSYIVPEPATSEHDVNFIKCLEESYLMQHVTKPTRYRNEQTPTLDDLILTRNSDTIEDLQFKSHLGATDHLTLQFEINFNLNKPHEVKRPKLNYMKTDEKMFYNIMNRNWEEELDGKSPEEAYNKFLKIYNEAVRESVPAPYVSTSTKYTKPPWMKPSTLQLIKKKHNLLLRYLNTQKLSDKEAYHKKRNEVAHQTAEDRINYETKIAEETKLNVNAFWNYVNSNRKTKKSIPNLKKSDGSKAETDLEKAEVLNSQFSSVFTKEDISNLPTTPQLDLKQELTSVHISPPMIAKKLKNLRSDKSPGPDGVHPHLLKTFSGILSTALCKIYNISLLHQKLPSSWKTGTITALFKKGSKAEAKNYRPVSLTSVPCKIMESLIVDVIIDHLTINFLKNPNQHGFTKGRSTITNLLCALNIWSEALSHGIPVDIVYLDFEKAFDKVPHQRLLNQVNAYGIRGEIHAWISDFLSNRTQSVRVNSAHSTSSPVLSGVPQGSVLGPVLFLIYVTNISDHINNFTSLFADDTKLFSYILEDHSTRSLQEDIDKLTYWSENMQMSFNMSKCHVMHLGRNNNNHQYSMYKTSHTYSKSAGTAYKLTFYNLADVTEETDLGICIDDQLSFSDHITAKLSKANKMLHVIKNTFKNLTPEIFKKLYTTLVRPHLEYGTPIWSPHTQNDIQRIESLQRRATKIVRSIQDMPYSERLRELKLPTLEYRRTRQDLILLWNITSGNISLDLNTYCRTCPEKKMLEPSLSTRTRGHELKYQIHHHQGARNYFFTTRIIPLWNRLNQQTVTAPNINTFKSRLANDPVMPDKHLFSKI